MLNDVFQDELDTVMLAKRQRERREVLALCGFLQDHLDEFQRHASVHGHLEPEESYELLMKLTRHAAD
jgi:hypothetical protein